MFVIMFIILNYDLILMFGLERIKTPYTALMAEWTDATTTLSTTEQTVFDKLWFKTANFRTDNFLKWQQI